LQDRFVPVFDNSKAGKRKEIWLTYKAVKSIKRKHKVYNKYKDNCHPACVAASRKVREEVRKAKQNFEEKLAKNIKSDTKSFFAYVRSKSKAKGVIGPVVNKGGTMISSNEGMCEEFNNFFTSVFTEERVGNIPVAEEIYKGSN
jgi:hypothetical protein